MGEILHPGVFVEEVRLGPKPIEGVSTSTCAMLGATARGSLRPRLVTSVQDYRRCFGGLTAPGHYLPQAINGFFENGGQRAYICRLTGDAATTASAAFGDFVVRAAGPGAWGNRVMVKVSPGTQSGFRLQLAYWDDLEPSLDPFADPSPTPPPTYSEVFDNLADVAAARELINQHSVLATLEAPDEAQPEHGVQLLTGGGDDPSPLTADPITSALTELEDRAYRDIALVYSPAASPDVARALIAHCETMRYRMAVIDAPPDVGDIGTLEPAHTLAGTSYAAFYYPWLVTSHPETGVRELTPPGGHVLGIYARTDATRGVWKAPANEAVNGVLDVEFEMNAHMQEVLNPRGVNTIRRFPRRGINVWGARTLSSDATWKYVNVRRLLIFLERSIDEGTQWVVFEPNGERLWARLTDTIRLFLRAQWRQGALQGRTEQQAFFIHCDRTTMSQDDLDQGRLICEIGVAPVRPAEFVIFRIGHQIAV